MECTQCPEGYACPSKTDELKLRCPLGTYAEAGATVSNFICQWRRKQLLMIDPAVDLKQ